MRVLHKNDNSFSMPALESDILRTEIDFVHVTNIGTATHLECGAKRKKAVAKNLSFSKIFTLCQWNEFIKQIQVYKWHFNKLQKKYFKLYIFFSISGLFLSKVVTGIQLASFVHSARLKF
jgi:hypothetical protein